jgi:hypothetical protein
MTPVEFTYWLKGYMDGADCTKFEDWHNIKRQLDQVINDNKNVSDHPFVKTVNPFDKFSDKPAHHNIYVGTGKPPDAFFLGDKPCESNH